MSKHKQDAFTLIELLVVIAIIGLLASILLVALSNARLQGRDAKRKIDLQGIATALELYYDQVGGYPAMGDTGASASALPFTNFANSNPACNGKPYCEWTNLATPLISEGVMATVPVDPVNTNAGGPGWPWTSATNSAYMYFSNGTYGNNDATHYVLCAWLENHSDPLTLQYTDVGDPFNPGTFLHANDGYSAYSYCLAQ